MDKKVFLQNLKQRMDGALKVLDSEFKGLRTGRASINLLDPVIVEAYGSKMPLSQVGTIATPDAKTITVQVWDKSMVKLVEKAIADANLGLNSSSDGQLIRLPIPPLNQERRKDLIKLAYKYAEEAKVPIRNIRRDGMDELKKLEKDGQLPKDEAHSLGDELQNITEEYNKKSDELAKA